MVLLLAEEVQAPRPGEWRFRAGHQGLPARALSAKRASPRGVSCASTGDCRKSLLCCPRLAFWMAGVSKESRPSIYDARSWLHIELCVLGAGSVSWTNTCGASLASEWGVTSSRQQASPFGAAKAIWCVDDLFASSVVLLCMPDSNIAQVTHGLMTLLARCFSKTAGRFWQIIGMLLNSVQWAF